MNISLFSVFDPLPGDPEQEGRYATLARLFVKNGHKVTWWTTSFSHRFKKNVDQTAIRTACNVCNIEARFLSVPPYYRNIGLSRLWNHYLLAKRFREIIKNENSFKKPDIVIASIPPLMLARQAAIFARECSSRLIIDIQDLWPETFYRIAPGFLRPFLYALFFPWHKASRYSYTAADAIVGVADEYVELASKSGGKKRLTSTIPLGIDLSNFDTAAEKGSCNEFTKRPGEIWLTYTGSLSQSYDCLTIVHAFAQIQKISKTPLRLFITGIGELQKKIEQIIFKENISNITLTGFLDSDRFIYLISQCDIGFNASFPEALIYFPKKIFYYMAASLAILNTIPGQCSKIVRRENCGLDYKAGDVESCTQTIEKLLSDPKEMAYMKINSRHLAQTLYDHRILYNTYINLTEKLSQLSRH